MSLNRAIELKKIIETEHRVIIHGLPGMGKTHLALQMSKLYKVCIHFDCEVDFPYFEEMLNAYKVGFQNFVDLLITFGDVNPFFEEDFLFVFDNIECSEIFYRYIFPIFKSQDLKMLMTMRVKNKSISDIISESVIYKLRPFCFKEFYSSSEGEWPEDIIAGHITMGQRVPPIIHRNCIRLLEDYLVTGGIPEAYRIYLASDTPEEAIKNVHEKYKFYVFEKLLEYAEISDSCKYRCRQVVNSVVDQMLTGKYNRFFLGKIRDGASYDLYKDAIEFLVDNNYLIKVNEINNNNHFKLFFYDCGIIFDMLLQRSNRMNVSHDFSSVSAIIYQNYIAQEFACAEISSAFWKSKYTAVVDSVLTFDDITIAFKLFPNNDLRDKTLESFNKHFEKTYLIKLSKENLSVNEKYFCLPVYAISCMGNKNFRKLFLNVVEERFGH